MKFIGLREYSPSVRLQLIEYALRRDSGYGLVIIDGIRDLMLDINNPSESVKLINKLMHWSSHYNLHIHCVLHLNKGDDNVRGHIGTELSNKAETVLVLNRSNVDAAVSEVRPLIIRDKDFIPFAFKIDKEGMPTNINEYSSETGMEKKKRFAIADITDAQHQDAIKLAFDNKNVISGYENLQSAMERGYSSIGFPRGRTTRNKLYNLLLSKGFIVKLGRNEYKLSVNVRQSPTAKKNSIKADKTDELADS